MRSVRPTSSGGQPLVVIGTDPPLYVRYERKIPSGLTCQVLGAAVELYGEIHGPKQRGTLCQLPVRV